MASFATHFYFSPRGRTGRRLYWMFGVVPLALVSIIYGFLLGILVKVARLPLEVFWLLFVVGGLIGMWSWICIGARRLHDLNQSGWSMLVALALPIGIAFVAPALVAKLSSVVITTIFGVIPGMVGANAFGADPNERAAGASVEVNVRSNTSLEGTRDS